MKFQVSFQVRLETLYHSIVLYEYTNKEQEIVSSCFRVGNYFSLRDLPDEIGANNVL